MALRLWPVASRSHAQRSSAAPHRLPWGDHARCRAKASQEVCRQGWDATDDDSKLVETAGTLINFFLSLNLTYYINYILSHTFTQPFVFCLPLLALAFLQPSVWWNCPTEPALDPTLRGYRQREPRQAASSPAGRGFAEVSRGRTIEDRMLRASDWLRQQLLYTVVSRHVNCFSSYQQKPQKAS